MAKNFGKPRASTRRKDRGRELAAATSVTAAVMMALYGAPAMADEEQLQEIIVTATRRAASAQDIPISITAVSGSSLEEAGIRDIGSLMQSVAGVNFDDKGPFSGTSASMLIIRGLNSDANAGSVEPGVATPVVPPVATYLAAFRSGSRRDSARSPRDSLWLRIARRHGSLRSECSRSERVCREDRDGVEQDRPHAFGQR